jgi:hypothetical protein
MFAISQALAHQQLLIEHLVRVATASMALREAEHLASETPLSAQQLARLRAQVEALDFQSGLAASVVGERGMGYFMFRHAEQFDMTDGGFNQKARAGPGRITRAADCLAYLQLQRDLVAAAREPFPAALDGAGQVEMRLKKLAGDSNVLQRYNLLFTLLIMPAMTTPFEATGRNVAHRDLVLCAISARQYEAARGELPAALADLVPEFLPAVPADPFDGQPLRMVATAEGLTIYSIGSDRKDDGGSDPERKGDPDVVVRIRSSALDM